LAVTLARSAPAAMTADNIRAFGFDMSALTVMAAIFSQLRGLGWGIGEKSG
jgi:hypothetical protein